MSSLSLKCGSCDAEMTQSFKKNEQGRNICAWTCPCGVAKPKSDTPVVDFHSYRLNLQDWFLKALQDMDKE